MAATEKKAKSNIIADFFTGEVSEFKRIKWPHFGELMSTTGKVIFFCVLFAIFFMVCDYLISTGMIQIGVGR